MKTKQFNNEKILTTVRGMSEEELERVSFLASNNHMAIQEYLDVKKGLGKWF